MIFQLAQRLKLRRRFTDVDVVGLGTTPPIRSFGLMNLSYTRPEGGGAGDNDSGVHGSAGRSVTIASSSRTLVGGSNIRSIRRNWRPFRSRYLGSRRGI